MSTESLTPADEPDELHHLLATYFEAIAAMAEIDDDPADSRRLAPFAAMLRQRAAEIPTSASPREWLRLLLAGEKAEEQLRQTLAIRNRARELQAAALMLADLPIAH